MSTHVQKHVFGVSVRSYLHDSRYLQWNVSLILMFEYGNVSVNIPNDFYRLRLRLMNES